MNTLKILDWGKLKREVDFVGYNIASRPAGFRPRLDGGASSFGCDIRLAQRACELTDYKVTACIGTLAAAYAEAGRFEDAVATAQKACDLAIQNNETNLLQKNQELLELYRSYKPYHEALPIAPQ